MITIRIHWILFTFIVFNLVALLSSLISSLIYQEINVPIILFGFGFVNVIVIIAFMGYGIISFLVKHIHIELKD